MKYHTDADEIALLGLCDRLGRTGSKRKEEEENIRLFLQACRYLSSLPKTAPEGLMFLVRFFVYHKSYSVFPFFFWISSCASRIPFLTARFITRYKTKQNIRIKLRLNSELNNVRGYFHLALSPFRVLRVIEWSFCVWAKTVNVVYIISSAVPVNAVHALTFIIFT